MSDIVFENYSVQCKATIQSEAVAFLHEVAGEIVSQTQRNYDAARRVKTGETKGSFRHEVDEGSLTATMGSAEENAIWEEFGTGVHAMNGDGRSTPWCYQDVATGKWYTTRGKTRHRPFFTAFEALKSRIQALAAERFGAL